MGLDREEETACAEEKGNLGHVKSRKQFRMAKPGQHWEKEKVRRGRKSG